MRWRLASANPKALQQKSIFHSRFLAAVRVYSQLAKRMLRYASLDIANASTPFKVHLKKHGMEYESFYIHSNYTKKYTETNLDFWTFFPCIF